MANQEALVCPNCGSDAVGTIEKASIWQRATFRHAGEEAYYQSFKDAQGTAIEADWELYDSEDVGDTETVGFFCRGCVGTWDGTTVPFVPGSSQG